MTKWILILYMSSGHAGGPLAVTFHSHDACVQAAATMKAERVGYYLSEWICIRDSDGKSR